MVRHALKLIWNRRRANGLVIVEIAVAFVVTFVLLALLADLWSNYRRPLGFDYEDVWRVGLSGENAGFAGAGVPGVGSNEAIESTLEDVLRALRDLPSIVSVEPILITPFNNITWNTFFGPDAASGIRTRINRTTGAALGTLGVVLVDGRLFGAEDEGQDYRPVVVNRTFAEQAFGSDRSPLGARINHPDTSSPFYEAMPEEQRSELLRELRVVGILEDFRMYGEFSADMPLVITRYDPADVRSSSQFDLLVKVAPGTDSAFEEDIVRTAESVAPGWIASVVPWRRLRDARYSETLLPFKVGATIAAFFLALVLMGLIGVLWQDVVRRTQEIGLRRALGASGSAVRRQILLEVLVVCAFGMAIGAAVAIQFPLLELVARIDWAAAVSGIALAAVVVLAMVVLGALYPSWLASRRAPADALRYE